MKAEKGIFALSAILLLILFPLAAGCLSVPGPESQKKTPTVTAAVTRSPVTPAEVTTIVQRTVVTAPTAERTTAPLSPSVTTAAPVTRYAADTCTGQGGFLVLPGQGCSGAWLVSTNTFSCCSAEPVTVAGSTRSLSVVPFTLTVNIDDSLGSIHP